MIVEITLEQAKQIEREVDDFSVSDQVVSEVTMSGYQSKTEQTAIYPDEFPDFITPGLVYTVLGLEEAGEVQGKLKKAIREDNPSYLEDIPYELGDLLWYVARVCEELEAMDETTTSGDLGHVAQANLNKLLDRKERGKLEGEGDHR